MNIQEDNLNQEREREKHVRFMQSYVEDKGRGPFNWYNFSIPSITSFQLQASKTSGSCP